MLRKFKYMGVEIDPGLLMSQTAVLRRLNEKKPTDETLDGIRKEYEERFGLEMAWRYPGMDDPHKAAVILPVQEGFLWLPLDPLYFGEQISYDLQGVELLDKKAVAALVREVQSYADGLVSALEDVAEATPDHTQGESVVLELPDGQLLRAIVNHDKDYPSVSIHLEGSGAESQSEELCFAEYNPERPEGHRLCLCAYTVGEDEPAYYKSYSPCEADEEDPT